MADDEGDDAAVNPEALQQYQHDHGEHGVLVRKEAKLEVTQCEERARPMRGCPQCSSATVCSSWTPEESVCSQLPDYTDGAVLTMA